MTGNNNSSSDSLVLDSTFEHLSHYIRNQIQLQHIPGCSIAVIVGGCGGSTSPPRIWTNGFGFASIKLKKDEEGKVISREEVPATPSTIYRVASITKPVTSTMMMQLRDAGKLPSLDDPLEKYVPEIKRIARPSFLKDVDIAPITFRQVASHTAGLPTEGLLDRWHGGDMPSMEDELGILDRIEYTLAPSTEVKYSNFGIAMLGLALERIAGMPYAEYVSKNIFAPLGMESSFINYLPPQEQLCSRLATGYRKYKYAGSAEWPPPKAPFPDLGAFVAAGGLLTTVEDLAKFTAMQFTSSPHDAQPTPTTTTTITTTTTTTSTSTTRTATVLRGSTLREMRQPVAIVPEDWTRDRGYVAMGLGWFIGKLGSHTVVSHSGGTSGFSSNLAFIPELELGFVILCNTETNQVVTLTEYALRDILIPAVKLHRDRVRQSKFASTDLEDEHGDFSRMDLDFVKEKLCGKYRYCTRSAAEGAIAPERDGLTERTVIEVKFVPSQKKLFIATVTSGTENVEDRTQKEVILLPYDQQQQQQQEQQKQEEKRTVIFRIKDGRLKGEKVVFTCSDGSQRVDTLQYAHALFERI